MYRNTKWANEIRKLQDTEGKWGWFHTLSRPSGGVITTEQALRRLHCLGFTMEDDCIQKAVAYMDACLRGEKEIPDRREKLHDWDVFTELMLAAWIRMFTHENQTANQVAWRWARIITAAFAGGDYNHDAYVAVYRELHGRKPTGGRLIDFVNFYPVALLPGCLDRQTEDRYISHILNHETGIYYLYEDRIADLPERFASRKTSRYLAAVELLSEYPCGRAQLRFVADWLEREKLSDHRWDLGQEAKDGIYFPLSDHWRKAEIRIADCTYRISRLLNKLRETERNGYA